jgi:hypothetical protein
MMQDSHLIARSGAEFHFGALKLCGRTEMNFLALVVSSIPTTKFLVQSFPVPFRSELVYQTQVSIDRSHVCEGLCWVSLHFRLPTHMRFSLVVVGGRN